MSLRTKTLLAIVISILFMSVLLYLFSTHYWLTALTRIEEQNAVGEIHRLEKVLEHELDVLSAIADDWAAWDDTYFFMQDHNPQYITSNLVDDTFEGLSLDVIALVDINGDIPFGKRYDWVNQEQVPLSPEFSAWLSNLVDFPPLTEPYEGVKGFVELDNEVVMFAARQILTSSEEGPSQGWLVFGRIFDGTLFDVIQEQSQVSFSVTPLSDLASQTEEDAQIVSRLLSAGNPIAKAKNPEVFTAYDLLRDYTGRPLILLKIETSRYVYLFGLNGIRLLMLVSLLVGLVFMLINFWLINRYLLQRLFRLNANIRHITMSGNVDLRVDQEDKNDELGQLAAVINQMLERIAQSQAEISQNQEELAVKANLLADMNQTLEAEIEERKEIEQALKRKGEQQTKLLAAAHQLTSSLEVEEVLDNIAQGAREILQADRFVIFLLQEDGRTLKPVVAIDELYKDEVLATYVDIDHSLTGQSIKAKKGLIFNNANTFDNVFHIPDTPIEEEEHTIVSPLIIDDNAVGALLLNRNYLHFTAEELQLVETFAAYASSALKNARTHQLLQQEIAERRAVESAPEASETRYQQLVNNLPIGIYRTSPDGKILFANPAIERMFMPAGGEIPQDIKVTDFFVDPKDWEAERAYVDRDGVVRGFEMQMRRPDGSTLWVRDTFQAVFDDHGNLLYYEGSLEDISEKKRAEGVQKALYEIAQAALTTQSLDELYQQVHQAVGLLMPAQNFYIALFDEKNDLLSFPYFIDQFDPAPAPRPSGRGLTDYVIRHKTAILVDPAEFEQMEKRGDIEALGAPSLDWLGVPLISSSGAAIGAMVVQTYDESVRYTDENLQVMSIISTQVALAIERKSAENIIKNQRAFLRQIIDANPNMIFVKDRQGRYTIANQAAAAGFGLLPEDILGKTDEELCPVPSEAEAFRRDDLEVLHTLKEKFIPIQPFTDAAGKRHWLQAVKKPLIGFTDDVQILGVATDITERKLAEDQLTHNAFHDALTELPNRLLFMDRLSVALNRSRRKKEQQWFAVLFLDMDRFKTINDTLGHVLGDQFLVLAARRLQACLRSSDTIARFGGDEFVILLEDMDEIQDAIQVAERILLDLSTPFNLAGHEVSITASIGIVLNSPDYQKPEEILRDADIAMYRAKALGRNRYVIFNSAMRANVVEHLELEKELRLAIEENQLELHYQPITAIKTNKVIGFEALVRWRHPEKGLISPADFIPFAEETGLILPIGQWVMRQACRQISEWQKKYPSQPPLTVSVNLSNKQFSQPDLFEQVEEALQASGLQPNSLQLEITESVIMENAELTIATLERLVAMGVKIHIDDFGTGYSSLAYLHMLPINAIKIDRSFISGPSTQGNGMEIAQTIVGLAHDLHIDAIAEGVETEEQLRKLDSWCCEYAQGYLIARVLEPAVAEEFLRNSQASQSRN